MKETIEIKKVLLILDGVFGGILISWLINIWATRENLGIAIILVSMWILINMAIISPKFRDATVELGGMEGYSDWND